MSTVYIMTSFIENNSRVFSFHCLFKYGVVSWLLIILSECSAYAKDYVAHAEHTRNNL